MTELLDRSGACHPMDVTRWRGADGGPLSLTPLTAPGAGAIRTGIASQWRYADALPLDLEPLSLGEGWTPLLRMELGGAPVAVKAEWLNPTGSFKDRGVSVMLAALRSAGVEVVMEDSSGNGAASVAAYAAAAAIKARILAPADTSAAKLLQARAHGARIDLVEGTRQDTADEAISRSGEVTYASHSWHPFFIQGIKLLAYELWEQLGFRAPDTVVVPAGGGSLVLGCALGFAELLRGGHIETVPRIVGVQPQRCAPLVAAFEAGAERALPGGWGRTVAEGARIERPVRDVEVLEAVRATGGALLAVAEEEIAAALRELLARGLYVEPTSALAAAGVAELRRRGELSTGEAVVVVLTGSGLKAVAAIAELAGTS